MCYAVCVFIYVYRTYRYKLDYVAHALDLQKGEKLLDIGCGWGSLLKHMTEKYGAVVSL